MPDDRAADWAGSGVVALTGHPGKPPLVPPGNAATLARRIAARLAAATEDSDHPVRVDGAALLAERAAFTGRRRGGQVSVGGACRLLPTVDGWAAVSCARRDDLALLGALVGSELPHDPWPAVAAWLRTHTGAELAGRAAMLGLAAAPVSVPPGPAAAGPHAPAGPVALPTPGRPRSVAGLLVVDFSALWAGPLCAHLLGLAGARVIKVETPQRPDGARRGNPGFYRLLHAGHRAVVLDPATREGRRALAALVDAADIVIEASRPRALARFGLDAQASAERGAIWVSITANGRDSPRIGFGDDVAAGAGLVAYDGQRFPVFCGDALADPLTGLVAADLALSAVSSSVGASASGPSHSMPGNGRGMLFDVAMSDVVAATLTATPDTVGYDISDSARPVPQAATGWVVDTSNGPIPVAAPRHRAVPGHAPEPGEHTAEVLRALGIPLP